jgi:hypothetical protein
VEISISLTSQQHFHLTLLLRRPSHPLSRQYEVDGGVGAGAGDVGVGRGVCGVVVLSDVLVSSKDIGGGVGTLVVTVSVESSFDNGVQKMQSSGWQHGLAVLVQGYKVVFGNCNTRQWRCTGARPFLDNACPQRGPHWREQVGG